jgi:RNA-directed DNA polymerase
LDHLRALLKSGEFRPQPVRERKIPKPGGSGKVRRLGIPTVTDRVVQAGLKLVLEPIFEADFEPVSYGFRPERRAHDAIAEFTSSAPTAIAGCWTPISRRASTGSITWP